MHTNKEVIGSAALSEEMPPWRSAGRTHKCGGRAWEPEVSATVTDSTVHSCRWPSASQYITRSLALKLHAIMSSLPSTSSWLLSMTVSGTELVEVYLLICK